LKIEVFITAQIIYSILTNGKILFDFQGLMNYKENQDSSLLISKLKEILP